MIPTILNDTNEMRLSVHGSDENGCAVLVAVLDNLGKGASGAAVQNLNIMLGLVTPPYGLLLFIMTNISGAPMRHIVRDCLPFLGWMLLCLALITLFPDLVLVREDRVLFRELKTMKGRTTPDQKKWLELLNAAGHDAAVWRPVQWFDRTIERELT